MVALVSEFAPELEPELAYPIITWTVYPDYGNAPIVWQNEGWVEGPRVGDLCLHASEIADFAPDALGQQFDAWGCAWESTQPQDIDWQMFHQEGLRMTALLALWVAQFNIVVRYNPPYEDTRFAAHDNEVWMDPGTVARLADGLPQLQDCEEAWTYLLRLHGTDEQSIDQLIAAHRRKRS